MWKEKIIDSVEVILVMFTTYMIGLVIIDKMGADYYKVYAPALPTQSEPFFEDITA